MLSLIILSLGLAMDAFTVSLVRGSVGEQRFIRAAELGIAFGLAQGLMPLLGWGLGVVFAGTFQSIDHWIAFGLLVVLGGRMLMEAASSDEETTPGDHSRVFGLMIAAVATSVDAAAAGLTLPVLGVLIPLACLTIGVTTAALCTVGYLLGSRVPKRTGKRAELFGGLVLIALGFKILVDHLAG